MQHNVAVNGIKLQGFVTNITHHLFLSANITAACSALMSISIKQCRRSMKSYSVSGEWSCNLWKAIDNSGQNRITNPHVLTCAAKPSSRHSICNWTVGCSPVAFYTVTVSVSTSFVEIIFFVWFLSNSCHNNEADLQRDKAQPFPCIVLFPEL